MSPAPRRRGKKEAELESPEVTSDPGVTASNTPESDVASEDIEEVSPEEVAELDAEAVEAEADEPVVAQEEVPEVVEEPAEAPAEPPKPARRRTRKPKAEAEAVAEPAKKPARTAPAPRRRRTQREPGQPAPIVRAQAKYVRSSARKARLVCDHIRGKSVDEARAILAHTPRAVARDWSKLLESAVANAEHNHELVGEDLYVKAVRADEGPTIRRFRPRAMGRATKIRKRTAHLTILLTPKDTRDAGGRTTSSRRRAGRPAED
jgi:ribosomal protein L22